MSGQLGDSTPLESDPDSRVERYESPARQPDDPPRVETDPPDEFGRRWWVIGATKIAAAERDLAREVMPDEDAERERQFYDCIGADTDDNDAKFPLGSRTCYALLLTDDEAERFRRASNARFVVLDRKVPQVDHLPSGDPIA